MVSGFAGHIISLEESKVYRMTDYISIISRTSLLTIFGFAILIQSTLVKAKDIPVVLVYTEATGYRHASIDHGLEQIKMLGKRHGFIVDHSADSTPFTKEGLSPYSAIIFLSANRDILNKKEQAAFERYIQAGGGFVGVHAASNVMNDDSWHWYSRLVGGRFVYHPKSSQSVVTVVDQNDISTAHLGEKWDHFEEWYKLKHINPNITVLMAVDQGLFKNAIAGKTQPIAWKHDFDGGRAFYTALGHHDKTYDDEKFLAHLWGGIKYAMGNDKPLDYSKSQPEDWRIEREIVKEDIGEPVVMDFTPAGKLYIADRSGFIRAVNYDKKETPIVSKVPNINMVSRQGLGGMAFDPNYENNTWVYFYYSDMEDGKPFQHIIRYDMPEGKLDANSGATIIKVPVNSAHANNHQGGMLRFDAKGNLWISTGDDSNPHGLGRLYSPHADSGNAELTDDARRSSGNTMDLRGKILRIKPLPKGGYSIPKGNLFKHGDNGRPEIYAMGLRNPYRFTVDSRTNTLYWGDIGPDASVDDEMRGPRGYDEFNRTTKPGNFGWPLIVGHQQAYGQHNFITNITGEKFDPNAPVNDSRHNTGARLLPPSKPAWIAYPYNRDDKWYELGKGGRTAIAGEVYYSDNYPDSIVKLPPYFDGKLFIMEWVRNWIKAVDMKEDGTISKIEPFLPNEKFTAPIDMRIGPDGSIWVLEYGSIWYRANDNSRLTRITYNAASNPPPVPIIKVSKEIGAAPLTVEFDGSESYDRNEGDSLQFEWTATDRDGKRIVIANQRAFSHTFKNIGAYNIALNLRDTGGNIKSTSKDIKIGNEPAKIDVNVRQSGNDATYAAYVTDHEDGTTTSGDIQAKDVTVELLYRSKPQQISPSSIKAISLGEKLLNASNCLGCHHATEKSAGPSFTAIGQNYSKDRYINGQKRSEYLAERIIEGGAKNWGDVAMSGHPDLSLNKGVAMADYIMSFGQKRQPKLPLSGTIAIPALTKKQKDEKGAYVLQVTYRDQGANDIEPIVVVYKHVFK